jgi:hypothetical protein
MTLVASFGVENWPILVGDILASVPRPSVSMKPFNVPTHANVNAQLPKESEYVIGGLVQKVTVLSTGLVLCWAGSAIYARSVFREILERNPTPTIEDVCAVLDERQNEIGLDLFLTGVCLFESHDDDGAYVRFSWDSTDGWEGSYMTLPVYGDCYAGGTGAEALLSTLQNSDVSSIKDEPALEKAICHTLGHVAKLAGDQMRASAGVEEYFGGAFELATLLEGRLQKICATYNFFEARRNRSGEIVVTLHSALCVSYLEDYLVIRKLEFGGDLPNSISVDAVYVIRPVYRSISEEEKERLVASVGRPSMNSRFSVVYVHLPQQPALCGNLVVVNKVGAPDGTPAVLYKETDDRTSIEINSQVFESIERVLGHGAT